jgi:ribonuclease HI
VRIYSHGSCNAETRIGFYEIVLEYGVHRRYKTLGFEDTTANRCIIHGLIDGLQLLTEPCEVEFVTATKVGLSGIPKNKGPNVDLLKDLVSLLAERMCEFRFNEDTLSGEELKQLIHRYSNVTR